MIINPKAPLTKQLGEKTFPDTFNGMSRNTNLATVGSATNHGEGSKCSIAREIDGDNTRITLSSEGHRPEWGKYQIVLYDLSTREQISRDPLYPGENPDKVSIQYENAVIAGHRSYGAILVYPDSDIRDPNELSETETIDLNP